MVLMPVPLASFCRLHKMVFVLCLKGFSSVSIPSSQGYLEWRQQDLLLPLLSRHYQVHTSFLEFHVKKPGKKQFIKRPLKSASWRLPADSFVRFHRLLWLSYRQINDLLLASMRLAPQAREPHSSFCISIESQKSVQKMPVLQLYVALSQRWGGATCFLLAIFLLCCG